MLFYDDQTIHTFHNVGFWRIEIVLLCSKCLFCWNWHSSVGDQDVMVLQTKTSGCLSFALKMFCKNKILRWKCFAKTCTAAIDYFTAHVTPQWDAPGYYYPLKSSDASFTMGLFHLITSFLYSHSHTLSYLAKKHGILLLMSEMKFFQAFWESQQGRLAKTNHPAPPRENRAHCAGGHFRWKKISRYVEIHRKNRFDVRIQELVSKVQSPGPSCQPGRPHVVLHVLCLTRTSGGYFRPQKSVSSKIDIFCCFGAKIGGSLTRERLVEMKFFIK